MKNEFEHMDDLIAKVLAGEALPEEELRLAAWTKASPDHLKYINESQQLFDQIDSLKSTIEVDIDAGWKKLENRIEAPTSKIISIFDRNYLLRAAAAIFFLVTLGFILKWFFDPKASEPMVLASKAQSIEQKLPDGSKIFMNKNTEVSYSQSKKGEREVILKGEAFFEVKHKAEEPFVIHVNELFIKDIGTAFNVKALPENQLVEVWVEEGEVHMYTKNNDGIHIVQGEKAIYDKTLQSFSKTQTRPSENTMSYKTKQFNFQNNKLSEVIAQINAVYGSDIQLQNPEIANCSLSVSFHNENIEVMIAVIAETLDLKVEHKGKTILLSGEACSE